MSSHRDITSIRVLEGNADIERDTIVTARKIQAPEAAPISRPSTQDNRRIEELETLNAQLRSRIAVLEEAINSIRITGPGFSGQGPRGILYKPEGTDDGQSTGGGTTEIIAVKYDSGAGTVSARRMIGNLTDNGAYSG